MVKSLSLHTKPQLSWHYGIAWVSLYLSLLYGVPVHNYKMLNCVIGSSAIIWKIDYDNITTIFLSFSLYMSINYISIMSLHIYWIIGIIIWQHQSNVVGSLIFHLIYVYSKCIDASVHKTEKLGYWEYV
jgi:hypothetical protein